MGSDIFGKGVVRGSRIFEVLERKESNYVNVGLVLNEWER
jgi:hypothetical protein